jgi:acetyl/propionyl-CoA carboxylase alpha subunit
LRIACGETLTLQQEDIQLNGWAIACRINAEDPQSHFSPSLGTLKKVWFPENEGVRVDSGVVDGSVVTPYYDSMLAKLITWGKDRSEALERMHNALNESRIMGIKTIIPFHKAVLHHKKFIEGNFNTSFIQDEMTTLFHQDPDEKLFAAFLATADYHQEITWHQNQTVDYSKGKQLSPWIINKRLK